MLSQISSDFEGCQDICPTKMDACMHVDHFPITEIKNEPILFMRLIKIKNAIKI